MSTKSSTRGAVRRASAVSVGNGAASGALSRCVSLSSIPPRLVFQRVVCLRGDAVRVAGIGNLRPASTVRVPKRGENSIRAGR